jgi:hypothetical protein
MFTHVSIHFICASHVEMAVTRACGQAAAAEVGSSPALLLLHPPLSAEEQASGRAEALRRFCCPDSFECQVKRLSY